MQKLRLLEVPDCCSPFRSLGVCLQLRECGLQRGLYHFQLRLLWISLQTCNLVPLEHLRYMLQVILKGLTAGKAIIQVGATSTYQ